MKYVIIQLLANAQLCPGSSFGLEQVPSKDKVNGSNPFRGTIMKTIVLPYFDSNIEVRGLIINASNNRRYVILRNKTTKHKSSITYAKYILSYYLERNITSEEIVDHYDRNPFNDSLFNLRIVDAYTSVHDDTKRVKDICLTCILCKENFLRNPEKTRDGKAGPFCGKRCTGKYARSVQLGEPPRSPQPAISSEYFYLEKAPNNTIKDKEKAILLDNILIETIKLTT